MKEGDLRMSSSLNKKRRIILDKIDNQKEVSIMELGMYELTPYFHEEFDISLTEKIYLNQNYSRRIEHERQKKIYFAPEQSKALKFLEKHRRCILSAPTSFGKTLILKEYIFTHKPQVIVYIVPTNALAYELESSFKGNPSFNEYTIFDRVTEDCVLLTDEKLFFIGTQEKYLEINENWKNHIDLFVIDEAYKLEEKVNNQRAFVLSKVFLDSVIEKVEKTVLLTPISDLEGFEEYEFDIFESEYNAVDKVFHLINDDDFYLEVKQRCSNEKTLLFCKSPSVINEVCSAIDSLNFDFESDFISFLEDEIHPEWSVVKLLKKGILTHHGQMPKFVQNKMMNLYNKMDSNFNLLIGTNSISEGINTVTKNVFIHPDYDVSRNKMLIKNTIGRAGRLGVYPLGHIYSTVPLDDIENRILIRLSISEEEEKEEVLSSYDELKISEMAVFYDLSADFLKEIIEKYNYSLSRMEKILNVLKKERIYPGIDNLPWMAKDVFSEYTDAYVDSKVIKAYLQKSGKIGGELKRFERLDDRINYIKELLLKAKNEKEREMPISDIIDAYMKFVYSVLEYKIMPIVDIGMLIKEKYNDWEFGEHVFHTIEDCNRRYVEKNYGKFDYYSLTDGQKKIVAALKDYGMERAIDGLSAEILVEIEAELNVRCSAYDIMQAYKRLAEKSQYRAYYQKMIRYYL